MVEKGSINSFINEFNSIQFKFYREKFLRQELQASFDDGLLTCCGFRCGCFGFAVDFHLCLILFDSDTMNLEQKPKECGKVHLSGTHDFDESRKV
jgi:hypothetical protein